MFIIPTSWFPNIIASVKQTIQMHKYKIGVHIHTFTIPVDTDFSGMTLELLLDFSCLSMITQGNSYNKIH